MLSVLRQRDFALLWFAGLVSMTGDWMLVVALPITVYELTGSAFATGAILITNKLAALLLGSVAGVFVDRWDRKRTMVIANLIRGPALLLLLMVDSADRVWIVYVVAAVMSAVGQFFRPAENALLPLLVGKEQLVPANALNALNDNLGRLAGPALGGLVAAWIGLGGVAIIDAATYPGRRRDDRRNRCVSQIGARVVTGCRRVAGDKGGNLAGMAGRAAHGLGAPGRPHRVRRLRDRLDRRGCHANGILGLRRSGRWGRRARGGLAVERAGDWGLCRSRVIGSWGKVRPPVTLLAWGSIGIGLC